MQKRHSMVMLTSVDSLPFLFICLNIWLYMTIYTIVMSLYSTKFLLLRLLPLPSLQFLQDNVTAALSFTNLLLLLLLSLRPRNNKFFNSNHRLNWRKKKTLQKFAVAGDISRQNNSFFLFLSVISLTAAIDDIQLFLEPKSLVILKMRNCSNNSKENIRDK